MTVKIALFAVLFVATVGAATSLVATSSQCPGLGRALLHHPFSWLTEVGPSTTFTSRMAGTEILRSDQAMDFRVFRCADCTRVDRHTATFPSYADAEHFLAEQSRFADVLETQTGSPQRRAVLRYHSTRKFAIVRSCRNKVTIVESDSLPHALEFERRFVNAICK
jgi:hypothetical protein